jgi:hypothetical protein
MSEHRATNPTAEALKKMCAKSPHPVRCPAGWTGRCDQQGLITLYYIPADSAGIVRYACEAPGGSWSVP